MQKEDEKVGRPQGRGLRVAVVLLAVLSVGASALAAVSRNQLADERARTRRLAADLSDTRDRLAEVENENRNNSGRKDPDPPPTDGGDENPFADAFGGDISTLLRCVGADDSAPGTDSADQGHAQVHEISQAVEQLRGLTFDHKVDVKFLTPTQVAKKAAHITLEDYPQKAADAEGRMLQALGAIPIGTDLRNLTKDLIESQVAGFYVPSTDRLYVPGDPNEPLSAAEKVILAHELTHGVTDGRLELPLSEHPDPADLDKDLAALAVVEGDATLLMQRYAVTHLSVLEQLSMTNDPAYQASQEAIAKVPPYLVEQLTYPYVDGLNFTCELFARGGWKAVNRAYAHPPTSTAQVLFPDRYRSGKEPNIPSRPPAPGAKWKTSWHSSFGAANLLWLFKAPGGDEAAAIHDLEKGVAAWGGGAINVWTRGPDTSLALRLVTTGGHRLCSSVTDWYEASFTDDSESSTRADEKGAWSGRQTAVVTCPDTEVRLGVGPDLATARRVVR